MATTNLSGPLVVTGALTAGTLITSGGTISSENFVISGTATAATVKWATGTATGGTASSTGIVIKETVNALDLAWGTTATTGGTANATGVITGGYLQSANVVYFGTRKVGFTAASAGWTTGSHLVGDVYLNGAPAGGSAVGWICSGTGTGTAATFIGFGSIFAG